MKNHLYEIKGGIIIKKHRRALFLACILALSVLIVPFFATRAEAAHIHDRVYTVNPIPGNCKTLGRVYWHHFCSICGVGLGPEGEYTSYGPHNFYTAKAATCTSSGLSKCSVCGTTQTIALKPHQSNYYRITRAATKNSTGIKTWYCNCGKVVSISTIPKVN